MKPVVIFDGVCNLCNGAVRFLIRHDKAQNLLFASYQSPGIASFLSSKNINSLEPQSILFIKDDVIYDRTNAVYEILGCLPRLKFLQILFFLPLRINNKIYTFVAQNRYRIFGKKAHCMLPTAAQQDRFITKL